MVMDYKAKSLIQEWSKKYDVNEPQLEYSEINSYNPFYKKIFFNQTESNHPYFILAHEFGHHILNERGIKTKNNHLLFSYLLILISFIILYSWQFNDYRFILGITISILLVLLESSWSNCKIAREEMTIDLIALEILGLETIENYDLKVNISKLMNSINLTHPPFNMRKRYLEDIEYRRDILLLNSFHFYIHCLKNIWQ